MHAFGNVPIVALVLVIADLCSLSGIFVSPYLARRFLESVKREGRLGSFALFLASWGTGRTVVIVWSYRISFLITAAVLTFVLFAWATR
jgi:hypothetical protein